jgi:hypothetical protein
MSVEFAYAQARAQARFGDRPPSDTWRLLDSSVGLAQFFHLVRGTNLARHVQHLTANTSSHAIERSLRNDWHAEVDNVRRWVPVRWRPAVSWTRWLPVLPALAYLLGEGPPLRWMQNDRLLSGFALDDPDRRRRAVEDSEIGPALTGVETGDLLDGWLQVWKQLWPDGTNDTQALDKLVGVVEQYLRSASEGLTGADSTREQVDQLEARVVRLMRRHHGRVVVVFCHLMLTALDYYRLRAGLVGRAFVNDVSIGARR